VSDDHKAYPHHFSANGSQSMITTIFALAVSLQSGGEVGATVKNDNPQTWTVEYPRVISSYVEEYYSCLKSRQVVMHAGTNFEAQHRLALAQCTTVREQSINGANALLAKRAKPDEDSPEEIAATFNTIELIHIARGQDLDQQMAVLVQGKPYERKIEVASAIAEPAVSDNEAATQ
jgi:hypothetical protein